MSALRGDRDDAESRAVVARSGELYVDTPPPGSCGRVPELPGYPPGGTDEFIGTDLEPAAMVLMADSPMNGDVLITSEGGRHLLSVVPHPHRLSLSEYSLALQIAKRWAEANKVAIWQTSGGVFTRLPRD